MVEGEVLRMYPSQANEEEAVVLEVQITKELSKGRSLHQKGLAWNELRR